MFRCLSPGAIGISASFDEALSLASESGFEGLEVNIVEIASLQERTSMGDIKQLFRETKLAPGAWGLPVNWQGDETSFAGDLARLPRLAKAAQELECFRTATWVSPASDTRDFKENFAWHRDRLQQVARILADFNCSLGLEFIGPATLRRGKKHEFIYTMAGMLELAAACGPNVGLLLDCWHWYTAGGTVAELQKLTPDQVVYVHVNDAPEGVAIEEQIDNVRCLPGATGVIDISKFLQTLQRIGYVGPVTPEPFNKELREMSHENAARAAGQAMKQIWAGANLQ